MISLESYRSAIGRFNSKRIQGKCITASAPLLDVFIIFVLLTILTFLPITILLTCLSIILMCCDLISVKFLTRMHQLNANYKLFLMYNPTSKACYFEKFDTALRKLRMKTLIAKICRYKDKLFIIPIISYY